MLEKIKSKIEELENLISVKGSTDLFFKKTKEIKNNIEDLKSKEVDNKNNPKSEEIEKELNETLGRINNIIDKKVEKAPEEIKQKAVELQTENEENKSRFNFINILKGIIKFPVKVYKLFNKIRNFKKIHNLKQDNAHENSLIQAIKILRSFSKK